MLPAPIIFLAFPDLAALGKHFPWRNSINREVTIGVYGFALFVANILAEVFKGDLRPLERRKGIERYTELLQEIAILESQGSGNNSPKTRVETFESFNKVYLQVAVTSPTFTDKQFERGLVYLVQIEGDQERAVSVPANATQLLPS